MPLRLISKCLYNRAPLITLSAYCGAHYGRRFQKHPYGTARFVKRKRPIQLTFGTGRNFSGSPGIYWLGEEKVFRSVRGGRVDPCKLNHYSMGSVFPKIAYSYSIRNITWRFNDLQDLLAKASPPRLDDYLAVIGRPVAEGQPRGSKERGRRQHWAQFLSPRTPWIQASRPAILRAHTGLKNRRTR